MRTASRERAAALEAYGQLGGVPQQAAGLHFERPEHGIQRRQGRGAHRFQGLRGQFQQRPVLGLAVRGTLTVLCYGYWIREEGRTGESSLKTCRIDLAAGYA